jgi:hypothetical protein
LFYDGSVVRKLETLSAEYSAVKESISNGKVMLDCVSQDLSNKIRNYEQEFHKEVETLRGGQPLNLETKGYIKSRAVKEKAMAAPVDVNCISIMPVSMFSDTSSEVRRELLSCKAVLWAGISSVPTIILQSGDAASFNKARLLVT